MTQPQAHGDGNSEEVYFNCYTFLKSQLNFKCIYSFYNVLKIIPGSLNSCVTIHTILRFPKTCLQITNIIQKSTVCSVIQSQDFFLYT